MSLDSPAVILYDASGIAMAVRGGVAIPANTSALLAAGTDGTTARVLLTDASGRPVVVGAGVGGTPAGGVLSVQGVAGGTAIPISGTVSATNPSVGTSGAASPASSTQIGGTDGTNLQTFHTFDLDTGAGSEFNQGVSIRLPGAGGSVAGGTSGNPIRTDPTGSTTQPISAAALPLPTGAAAEATLAGVLTTSAFQARINTQGQKAMAASTPVVVASDQSPIPTTTATSTTATRSDVAGNAASTTLLASNAARKGATIFNDSTALLYVKFGTTASATDFTVKMFPGDYYEVPFGYSGRIDGIWASAAGNARMTELT